jgi:hypothetical protein
MNCELHKNANRDDLRLLQDVVVFAWRDWGQRQETCIRITYDRTTAQAIRHSLLTAEAWVRASPSPSVFPCQFHSTATPCSFIWGMDTEPVKCPVQQKYSLTHSQQ